LLVCDKCSQHRIVLPPSYDYGPDKVRVCESCYVTALNIEYEQNLEQGIVSVPDYEAIAAKLLERVRYYLRAAEGCGPESDFDGVKVSTCHIEGSSVQCIRSKVGVHAL
jgi:hypothetical protein